MLPALSQHYQVLIQHLFLIITQNSLNRFTNCYLFFRWFFSDLLLCFRLIFWHSFSVHYTFNLHSSVSTTLNFRHTSTSTTLQLRHSFSPPLNFRHSVTIHHIQLSTAAASTLPASGTASASTTLQFPASVSVHHFNFRQSGSVHDTFNFRHSVLRKMVHLLQLSNWQYSSAARTVDVRFANIKIVLKIAIINFRFITPITSRMNH